MDLVSEAKLATGLTNPVLMGQIPWLLYGLKPGDERTVPPNSSEWISDPFHNGMAGRFPENGGVDSSGYGLRAFSRLFGQARDRLDGQARRVRGAGGWYARYLYGPLGNVEGSLGALGSTWQWRRLVGKGRGGS